MNLLRKIWTVRLIGCVCNPALMRRWLAACRVPYWPLGWLVNRYVESVIGAPFNAIAPTHTLAHSQCLVLLVHGLQDNIVPIDVTRRLWQHRGNAKVTMLECNGTHEAFDDMADVTRQILSFLKTVKRAEIVQIPSLSTETP